VGHICLSPFICARLQHALAVFPGDANLDEQGIPDESTLTNHCAGLVSIDEESRTVRLVHYTAQEYLERILPNTQPQAHTGIATTCLTYLLFDAFANGECDEDEVEKRLQEYPLLGYAAKYWSDHARRGSENQAKDLILRLLKRKSNLSCSIQADRYKGFYPYFPEPNTLKNIQIRLRSFKELIRGGGYNRYSLTGKTRLHLAAGFRLRSIVRLLVEEGANMTASDGTGMRALDIAAAEGFADIVQLLPASTIDSEEFYRPLEFAMARGHEGAVRVLLERGDAEPGTIFEEQTVLTWAVENGYLGLINLMLLKDNVSADLKDASGRTALSYAAENGRGKIVRLLLDSDDVNGDSTDPWSNRTPLSFAAERGNEEVVRLLLDREDVKPDSTGPGESEYSDDGRSPLSWAAGAGHEHIVRILLARDDVNVDSFDCTGRTPLSWAVEGGHERVVQQLIRGGAEVDAAEPGQETALGQFAAVGIEEAVKMLLRYGADIEARDGLGCTAMDRALTLGHVSVVQLLLENGARLNVESDEGTSLHRIVFNSNDKSIRWHMGQKEGGIQPNVTWRYEKLPGYGCTLEPTRRIELSLEDGRTEWAWTPRGGHKEMIELLLQEGLEIDAKNVEGRTALLAAVIEGHELLVRLLLDKGADINTTDEYGQTALHWAASNMNEPMLGIFLENGADVTALCDGGSALHFAASNGQEKMVRMLLAKGAEVDAVDEYQMTASSLAAINGHLELAKLLDERGRSRPLI
jgi:ankyrin repeat protein